jgi:hypothetical protein
VERKGTPAPARRRCLLLAVLAAVGLAVAGTSGAGGGLPASVAGATTTGIVPPANPPRNILAEPRLVGALCTSTTVGGHTTSRCDNPCADPSAVFAGKPAELNSTPACTAAAVAAIGRARSTEHVGKLVLPRDWAALTIPEQLFVVADLERVARGVPPLVGLVPALDAAAAVGARAGADPVYPLSARDPGPETSNWAGGEYSSLIADYVWMYQDGWGEGNGNGDCTAPHARGCWGHRDAILGALTGTGCTDCLMGAAFVGDNSRWGTSFAELFVVAPPDGSLKPTFTWARDVLPELPAA